jgi:hypothetical protein
VQRVSAGVVIFTEFYWKPEKLSWACVRILGPNPFWVPGNRWTSTRLQMNEGKSRTHGRTFVWNALGYRFMQLRPRGWEMEDYGRRGHFFTFWRLATFGVHGVRVRILFVETRKRKVSSKVSSQRTTNQPPSRQTNQPVKNKKTVGPRGGVSYLFFQGLIFRSLVRPRGGGLLIGLNRTHVDM